MKAVTELTEQALGVLEDMLEGLRRNEQRIEQELAEIRARIEEIRNAPTARAASGFGRFAASLQEQERNSARALEQARAAVAKGERQIEKFKKSIAESTDRGKRSGR